MGGPEPRSALVRDYGKVLTQAWHDGIAMAFDTQRAARRLTDAGLDDRAAQGVADVVVRY